MSALTGGEHTFEVRAIDQVPLTDATPASYTWNVVAPPATTILTAPAALSTSADATFTFFDQPGSTYECRLDPVEVPIPTPFETCVSGVTYTDLTNGAHRFEVRATAPLLNGIRTVETPPVSHEWTIDAADTTAPNTSLDLGPADPTTSTSATFIFSGTDNLTAPVDLTFECRLDSTSDLAWVDCDERGRLHGPARRRPHVRGPRVRLRGHPERRRLPGHPLVDDRRPARPTRRPARTSPSTSAAVLR